MQKPSSTAMSLDPVCLDPACLDPVCLDPVCLDPVCLDPVCLDPVCLDPVCLDPVCLDPEGWPKAEPEEFLDQFHILVTVSVSLTFFIALLPSLPTRGRRRKLHQGAKGSKEDLEAQE